MLAVANINANARNASKRKKNVQMLTIEESGNVHDRIAALVYHFCKGNATAFGRGADIQSGVLAGITSGRRNKPSFDVVQKILTGYPSVSPRWLIFGLGPMLLEGEELTLNNQPSPRTLLAAEQTGEVFTKLIPFYREQTKAELKEEILAELREELASKKPANE